MCAKFNRGNSIWFWGAGTKPCLASFEEKTGKRGIMISAVDLLKGIAVGAGMKVASVEGADGTLHTNYEGKAMAAVHALLQDGFGFAYIHVEAPDEMGHQMMLVSKAPLGRNRHKYVCLQVNLQHHILCSVSAKHSFDPNIINQSQSKEPENLP